MSEAPRWRQAFDAVDKAIAPHAETFVRTPGFSTGVALLRRAQVLARSSARDVTARTWHLLNLPAGSDVSRLRAQIGALDREVRRLTVQLEKEQLKNQHSRPETEERPDADRAQPAGGARPRPARRRTQRPAGS